MLADELDLEPLTLAALAERLGVRQPSLYKHIDSLAGLHRDLAVLAKRRLVDELVHASVGRAGADAIRAMSHAYRAWAVRHPAAYRAAMTMPGDGDVEHEAAALSAVQVIADVLRAFDLEGDDAIDAIRAFRATLHGFVSLETMGSFALAADVERSFARLIQGFVGSLAGSAGDAARTPQTVSSSRTASP